MKDDHKIQLTILGRIGIEIRCMLTSMIYIHHESQHRIRTSVYKRIFKKENKFVSSLIFSCKHGQVIEPYVNKIEDDVK